MEEIAVQEVQAVGEGDKMKGRIRFLIVALFLSFLFSGCFSYADVEYDDYYDDCDYVFVEVPVIVSPIVVTPVVEKPIVSPRQKTKYRTGSVETSRYSKARIKNSYVHRSSGGATLRNINGSRNNRNIVDKRIRERR